MTPAHNSIQIQRTIFCTILAIGLILRLAIVYYSAPYPERSIQADATGYNRIAINLLSGHGFSMKETAPFTPDNFRTPIYPFTVALCYLVFGYQPTVVLTLQAFVGLLTILIVYLIAKTLRQAKVGLIAATMISISPISITYTALLWSDTEYTLFLALSVLLTILMLSRTDLKWVLLSGFVAGISTLTHVRSLYLPFFFASSLLAVRLVKRLPVARALTHAILYLVAFLLVIFPWQIRNLHDFGVPNLSSAAGINMLHYGAALTEAIQSGEDQWTVAKRYDDHVRQMTPTPVNEAEYSNLALQLAIRQIAKYPITFAKAQVIGMTKVFLPSTFSVYNLLTGAGEIDTSQIYAAFIADPRDQGSRLINSLYKFPAIIWAYIGFETLFLATTYLFSLYAFLRQRQLWLLAVCIFYLAAVAGPAGAPRFRVAMMPLFAVSAAFGLTQVLNSPRLHAASSDPE